MDWRLKKTTLVALAAISGVATGLCQTPTPTPPTTVYVSDTSFGGVLKFDAAGQMTVFASGISEPAGLAFDNNGNLYVASTGQDTIYKYDPSGSRSVFSSGGGSLHGPRGLAFDSNGVLYVGNVYSYDIITIDPDGQQNFFLGIAPAVPFFLAFDRSGNLYFTCTTDNTIHRGLTTFASGLAGPAGLAFDSSGNLYVANLQGQTIQKLDSAGQGTVFANTSSSPYGIAFDTAGNLYAAEANNNTIEKFNSAGEGSFFAFGLGQPYAIAIQPSAIPTPTPTPASSPPDTFYVTNFDNGAVEQFTPDGVGSLFAVTVNPTGLAFDVAGNLFVASDDPNGYSIRKFSSTGNDLGIFASTGLSSPHALAFDNGGSLYVANPGNSTIEKYAPDGVGSVFADNTNLNFPIGLAFDATGNLYVANQQGGLTNDGVIVKFTPAGVGSVFADTGLSNPQGLAFDQAGNLYVANHNNTIGKFTPDGIGSVFANAGLSNPRGVAFDSAGNLYVANVGNNTIEKFSATGTDMGVFANTGLSFPQFIAVRTGATPIPTPATPTPTPTPTVAPTPTPAFVSISGTISYCTNLASGPVPSVTLSMTGDATTSTITDGSGNYLFSSIPAGGSYDVTPSKAARTPGSPGISTVDVIATQRHFLGLGTPLSGCRLMAADVNGDTAISTVDVIAIQRFFLGLSTGIANTGKYKFSPVSRSYLGVVTDQTAQNYDTLIFGDVASPFAE